MNNVSIYENVSSSEKKRSPGSKSRGQRYEKKYESKGTDMDGAFMQFGGENQTPIESNNFWLKSEDVAANEDILFHNREGAELNQYFEGGTGAEASEENLQHLGNRRYSHH